jgi:predicted MPP superfamily phosphohydrolase
VNLIIVGSPLDDYVKYSAYFWVFGIYLIIYIPKLIISIFLLINLLLKTVVDIITKAFNKKIKFNSLYISSLGLLAGFVSFLLVLNGFIFTKNDFIVKEQTLYFNNLPASFENFKIVQISDLHLGSFHNKSVIEKAIGLIESQKPDMLFFTGDMINVTNKETIPYITLLNNIKTNYGKFSVLGNHDIGDYAKWDTVPGQKKINEELIKCERQMGFNVLIDTSFKIFKGQDSIYIAGVNNCGNYPFKKAGDLKKALKNIDEKAFVILLAHDPAQWSGEVVGKTNIPLTLSGHTHGMQLGINSGNIKWSPISLKYKYWLGLYKNNLQYLYVNPGLGFLGFPGRIGIKPEITVLKLKRQMPNIE